MKVVLAVLLLWLGLAVALWRAPVGMDHSGGTVPENETYEHACAFDEPGMTNCSDTSFYLWRLPANGTARTTWTPSRTDIVGVTGPLVHENPRCPGSRVAWTVTAGGRTSGTLAGDRHEATLDVPIASPVDRITLTIRRLDTEACTSALRWISPRLTAPFKHLP